MERLREPVTYRWQGPFPRQELPDEVLYDVVVSFRHDDGPGLADRIHSSLERLGGRTRVRHLPLLGARVSVQDEKWRLTGRARNGFARLRVHHRVKGKALKRLVQALSDVPAARDLRIDATRERFARPYTSIGPCSPCAAGRFGASR